MPENVCLAYITKALLACFTAVYLRYLAPLLRPIDGKGGRGTAKRCEGHGGTHCPNNERNHRRDGPSGGADEG